MWLDELPTDVCERIFRNLLIEWDPTTCIYRDVAALSRTSDKQNEAARLSLPTHKAYKLNIDLAEETFNELLAPNLQTLSLARRVVPSDEPLFRAPKLYAVALQANLDAFNVIAGCSSLRSLSLVIDDEVSWEQILECLRTLRLTQLWLQYESHYRLDNCPCVPFEGSSSGCNARLKAILSALPDLQHLVIRCNPHADDYSEQMTNHLLQVPNITKVNLISYNLSVHEQHVRKLRDVIVDDYTINRFETALQLGPLLTHFYAKHDALSDQQLLQLKKCKNLKAVSIALGQGAEDKLADLVHVLKKLRSLELFWPIAMTEDKDGESMRPSYAAFPGAIQRAADAGKKLIELKICNATVDALEVEQILQSLGKRLRTFTLTISYSDLRGLACLQRCLDSILKYNPSLSKLGVKWQGYIRMDPYRAKRHHKGPLRQLLRTIRLLYVRNKIIGLPYFLIALQGYYHLAFEYLSVPLSNGGESEEDEGFREIAMED